MTNWLSDYVEQLVDNGFTAVPIMPGTKKPGKAVGSGWVNFTGWQRYCETQPNSMELRQWASYPGEGGIGIPCGKFAIGIDIDVEDGDLAARIRTIAFNIFGETDAVRVGRAPKMMLVYRPAGPIENRKHHPIEIMSTGSQFVAFATHPDTGKPYQWPNESLLDLRQDELPSISQQQVDRFVEEMDRVIPAEMRPKRLRTGSDAPFSDRQVSVFGLEAEDRSALADAVSCIPNDVDWSGWNDVGMALWSATSGGEDGRSLWHQFSSRNSAYDERETDARWDHFFKSPPSRIGAGTIYDVARGHGWIGSTTPQLDAAQNVVDITAIIAGSHNRPVQPMESDENNFPLSGVDGALRQFVDYCNATASKQQPVLAVAAGLAALGSLMGRKYKTKTGLRSNLYCIGVAPSASGKDHARATINRLFADATLQPYMGGSETASGIALITALQRHPQMLMQWDEFGIMMSKMSNSNGKDPMADVMSKMMKLFSEAQGVYYGTEYADQKSRPRQVIIQPCLCVHGTTTPGRLYEALAQGSTMDGSIARFLFFPTETPNSRLRIADITPIPQSLTDAFLAVEAGPDDYQCLPMGNGPEQEPRPYTVPMTADADIALDGVRDMQEDRLHGEGDEGQRALVGRMFEHVSKIAMVKAVSRCPSDPVIDAADVRWAHQVVEYCLRGLASGMDQYHASSEYERLLKKVRTRIRGSGVDGMSMTDLAKHTQDMSARMRNEIVAHLQEAGDVIVTDMITGGRGRPQRRVTYCGAA